MRNAVVLVVMVGCGDGTGATDASVADASIDAYDPNPCQMVDVAYYASCVPDALPAMDGLWTVAGMHTDLHGTSRGALSLTFEFSPTTRPGCFDVTSSPVAPPVGEWPEPNGVWYADATLATLRTDIGSLVVFWDICVSQTSGQLGARARSGYRGTHTAYEWQEEFAGTLTR